MRKLSLGRNRTRRVYSDSQIAHALNFLSNHEGTIVYASKQLDIPQGTLSQWKQRYLHDDEFSERIDKFIDDLNT